MRTKLLLRLTGKEYLEIGVPGADGIQHFRTFSAQPNQEDFNLVLRPFEIGSIHLWRQMFLGHFWPTYPNQILYYISLCSKIRCSLTYLPTYLKIWRHMWMLPNRYINLNFTFTKYLFSTYLFTYLKILLLFVAIWHWFVVVQLLVLELLESKRLVLVLVRRFVFFKLWSDFSIKPPDSLSIQYNFLWCFLTNTD